MKNYFRPKDWHKRARDGLHKCIKYNIRNVSGYITAFHRAVSCVVGITDEEMLDRFVVGLKPKIFE